jgi:hypothetical protein
MDIEENDEVEREIDILFSGEFLNETKIFQFPLIPKSSMNTEKIKSLSASEDMKSMKMEMNLDQKYLDKNIYNVVPIKTLKGENIEYNSNLCLGIMKNNQLILTPISQFFQFRHDFSNINKERNLEIKIKKDKNERKNLNLEVKEDTKYNGLCVHQPQSMESKIVLERIASPEGEVKKANYMSKEEYYNLLLKYVITPDTSGDSNDDFLSLYKNASKESFLDTINEAKNEDMNIEEEKPNKKRGLNSGIDIIKTNEKEGGGNGIVANIINNIFEGIECLFYDDLLMNICSKMNIEKSDKGKIKQIKKEIEDNCIIVKDNICFIKNNDDSNDANINNVRNLLITEIGNNENGLKKQQIKRLIEQNGLTISDNKLTKLLQKICKYSGSFWIIKSPSNN